MVDNNVYSLINERLKNFLANQEKWKSFNTLQKDTIPIILGKNDTLIIAPTASGKTESCLIPIFDDILKNSLEPMSVLYVAPLKALINDMHNRIERWANHFNLTTTKWHGDVSKHKKDNFFKNPTDFLAITPESLEVILINRSHEDKKKVFKNIKYIIVDEIHYFIASDRGIQLNSLLNRINKYIGNEFIKIGLSATVGNPKTVAKWLNHKSPAKIVTNKENRVFQYKVFYGDEDDVSKYLIGYENKKILIFALSRSNVEKIYNKLKIDLNVKNTFLHHSSINRAERENSEKKFKQYANGFMVSTSTLELGIDIGNIDIVFQINSPQNVSSFLQRIGRGGRKSQIQRSIIITKNWGILITLAEIMLIKENKIEEVSISTNSKDIYFHQILSSVFEKRIIKEKDLFYDLKDCYVFSNISKEEYKHIITNMVEKGFLDKYDNNLSLGCNFEKKFGRGNFKEFYAVFCPNYDYHVKEGGKEIGTIDPVFALRLKVRESFILGGKRWKVIHIDNKRFTITVKQDHSSKKDIPQWFNEGPPLNYLITRKIYGILSGDLIEENLKTFDEKTKEVIFDVINLANEKGFQKGIIPIEINSETRKVFIYSFAGVKANKLLSALFRLYYEIYDVEDTQFFSSFKVKNDINFLDIESILYVLEDKLKEKKTLEFINQLVGKFYKNKFINFLPYEDQANLKMEIIFDKENLIDLIKNNTPVEVFDINFNSWIEKESDKEESENLE